MARALNQSACRTTSHTFLPMILKNKFRSLSRCFKQSFQYVKTEIFPDNLKLADITPVFKKKNPLHKVNYRPVAVLNIISKFVNFQNFKICPYLHEYKKGLSSHWAGGAVLIHLSKAFDAIKPDFSMTNVMHLVSIKTR